MKNLMVAKRQTDVEIKNETFEAKLYFLLFSLAMVPGILKDPVLFIKLLPSITKVLLPILIIIFIFWAEAKFPKPTTDALMSVITALLFFLWLGGLVLSICILLGLIP